MVEEVTERERDERSDCTVPRTLEVQSPRETVAAVVQGMTAA